jgi:hypothetical protein
VKRKSPLAIDAAALPALVRAGWGEEEFQREVVKLARQCGWRVAHFRRVRVQRKDGSCYYETPVQADGKGFVDLVCVRDRTVYMELKSETGRLTPDQGEWVAALQSAGEEVYVFKPRDWSVILAVLTAGRG